MVDIHFTLTITSLHLFFFQGISYACKNADGEHDWSGCCNVNLILLETGNPMGHYVQSFNINTNQWLAQYVYKRLKFLNNRTISYATALTFLAVWHGFHSGYYMSFLIEYMIITIEKQVLRNLINFYILYVICIFLPLFYRLKHFMRRIYCQNMEVLLTHRCHTNALYLLF